MHFIENDVRVVGHVLRFDQFLQQQSGGAEANASVFARETWFQRNLIADETSNRPHPFITHTFGNTASGQASRLRNNDVASFVTFLTIVQNHLRQLRQSVNESIVSSFFPKFFIWINCLTCVLLPQPVSPWTTITGFASIASSKTSRWAIIGNSFALLWMKLSNLYFV